MQVPTHQGGYLNNVALTLVAAVAVVAVAVVARVALPLAAARVVQQPTEQSTVLAATTPTTSDDPVYPLLTHVTATSTTLANGEVATTCTEDTDCMIVDTSTDYTQCYAGACDPREYWLERYAAVNINDFFAHLAEVAPTGSCGAEPECVGTLQPTEHPYIPVCSAGICQKQRTD